jgi:hypothetical protein
LLYAKENQLTIIAMGIWKESKAIPLSEEKKSYKSTFVSNLLIQNSVFETILFERKLIRTVMTFFYCLYSIEILPLNR